MEYIRLRVLGLAALMLPVVAFGQTRNSFFDVTNVQDINVTTSDGLTFLILLGPDPRLDFNNITYHVTDAFGFYALADDNDVIASAIDQNAWAFNVHNSGPGGLAGWEGANANAGIHPGQSISFTFTTLDLSTVDRFGFHFRYSTPFIGGGNTSFAAVPEPASMAALALGAFGLLRKRRR